jgi:hypothetical protein
MFNGIINGLLRLLGLTNSQRDKLTGGQNGEVLYNGEVDQFQGRRGGAFRNFLMAGDVSAADASETVKGVVEIATQTQYDAGTDVGETGAPLVATPGRIRAEMDTKVEVAGDISGTFGAPIVAQSTSNSGTLFRNVAGTFLTRLKSAAMGLLQVRNDGDTAFADLQAQNLTAEGDLLVKGNLVVRGVQTIVNSTDLAITDNTIIVNKDETGAGVSAGFAGIEVERGTETNAEIGFNEANDRFEAGIAGARKVIGYKVEGVLAAVASDEHVITHNLNTTRLAGIGLFDGNTPVSCEVEIIDANSIRLLFGVPVADYAYAIIG